MMKIDSVNSGWFPGHMKSAGRLVKENLKNVDVVFELIDSRAPLSSRNVFFDRLVGTKPRVVVLGKSDLADFEFNSGWLCYFRNSLKLSAFAINSKDVRSTRKLLCFTEKYLENFTKSSFKKSFLKTRIRAMVVGLPNVGKSTLINSLIRRRKVKVENRPGVTKSAQWVSLGGRFELLDMPGVLQLKFATEESKFVLALVGALKEGFYDSQEVANYFLGFFKEKYSKEFVKKFGEEFFRMQNSFLCLEAFGKQRGMFLKGGGVNLKRAADAVIENFRLGKFGKITLEDWLECQGKIGMAEIER